MGRTWKWAVLTGVVELAVMCAAQPAGFLADADARACLARSYSLIPRPVGASADPHEPWPVDYSQMNEAAYADGSLIVSYVVILALVSAAAALSAIGCLLILALAGVIAKVQDRPARFTAPASSVARQRFTLQFVRKLPV